MHGRDDGPLRLGIRKLVFKATGAWSSAGRPSELTQTLRRLRLSDHSEPIGSRYLGDAEAAAAAAEAVGKQAG